VTRLMQKQPRNNGFSGSHAPAWELSLDAPASCVNHHDAGASSLHSHASAWEREKRENTSKSKGLDSKSKGLDSNGCRSFRGTNGGKNHKQYEHKANYIHLMFSSGYNY